MLKARIDTDLKAALLAGDKERTTTLRSLKNAILYAEVAKGNRAQDTGMRDQEILALLAKEAKKRQESADAYQKGGDQKRAQVELEEKRLIESYLPEQFSDEELGRIVDDVIKEMDASGQQMMGQVIGRVRQIVENQADGARVAQMVKERLGL